MQAPGPETSAAPAAPPTPAPNRRRFTRRSLELSYAVCASALSVWVVSFAPAEGPPLQAFLPANASWVFQVRNGREFLHTLWGHRTLQSLLDDPDVSALYAPLAKRDQALTKLQQSPALVRWLFPATEASLVAVAGHELAVAAVVPAPAESEAEDSETDDKKHGTPALLLLTRLSGGRGHLLRMGARIARLPHGARCYDLGGGLTAIGFNGARPAEVPCSPPPPAAPALQASLPGGHDNGSLLGRLTILPRSRSPAQSRLATEHPQYEQLRNENVPESVLGALLQPPAITDMFNVRQPPTRISLDVYSTPQGCFSAGGRWEGPLPPLAATPTVTPSGAGQDAKAAAAEQETYAEGRLPIDLRACFLDYVAGEMRLHKEDAALTKGQRRWSRRFSDLAEAGVDLDRDLWGAMGHAVYLTVGPDPLDTTGYGLVCASVAFDGSRNEARRAAGELIRQRWNGFLFDDAVPPGAKPPYVKRAQTEDRDRYLLNTGRLTVPACTLSKQALAFRSNVGPYALRNPAAAPEPQGAAPSIAAASCYYLQLDGQRLAPTVERLATLYYDTLEEEMGAKDFLAQYPDAAVRIRLAAKVSRFLGDLKLRITPESGKQGAAVEIRWAPGKLPAPAEEEGARAAPLPPQYEYPPPRRGKRHLSLRESGLSIHSWRY